MLIFIRTTGFDWLYYCKQSEQVASRNEPPRLEDRNARLMMGLAFVDFVCEASRSDCMGITWRDSEQMAKLYSIGGISCQSTSITSQG
jgi:hypothetical protein